jgi:hypothetical protein
MSGLAFETDSSGNLVVKFHHDDEAAAAYKRESEEQIRRIKAKSRYWREREAVDEQERSARDMATRTARNAELDAGLREWNELAESVQKRVAKLGSDRPQKFTHATALRFELLIISLFGAASGLREKVRKQEQRIAELEQRNRVLASSNEAQS